MVPNPTTIVWYIYYLVYSVPYHPIVQRYSVYSIILNRNFRYFHRKLQKSFESLIFNTQIYTVTRTNKAKIMFEIDFQTKQWYTTYDSNMLCWIEEYETNKNLDFQINFFFLFTDIMKSNMNNVSYHGAYSIQSYSWT